MEVRGFPYCVECQPLNPRLSLGCMLALSSPSSNSVLGSNTGKIKAVRKGTGHPTSRADGSA